MSEPLRLCRFATSKLWSPDAPFLYDLRACARPTAKRRSTGSPATSACARSRSARTSKGITRLLLNDKPLFQFGPLDQGFWPDGLYTAPTDEALNYDIEITKKLGFNMVRKHVKVEPARWYYWCDKLGLLVWQDMPSGDRVHRATRPGHQPHGGVGERSSSAS